MLSLQMLSAARRWAPVPLRLIVGYGFVAHGMAKIMNGPAHFGDMLQVLGVPAPHAMACLTIAGEIVGGLAVLAGRWIPLFSIPLSTILLVAALTVHLPYGFSSIKLRAVTPAGAQFGPPGYETDLLYLAALAALVLGGSGPLALDRKFGSPRAGDPVHPDKEQSHDGCDRTTLRGPSDGSTA